MYQLQRAEPLSILTMPDAAFSFLHSFYAIFDSSLHDCNCTESLNNLQKIFIAIHSGW